MNKERKWNFWLAVYIEEGTWAISRSQNIIKTRSCTFLTWSHLATTQNTLTAQKHIKTYLEQLRNCIAASWQPLRMPLASWQKPLDQSLWYLWLWVDRAPLCQPILYWDALSLIWTELSPKALSGLWKVSLFMYEVYVLRLRALHW